jgi:hypothetical protein
LFDHWTNPSTFLWCAFMSYFASMMKMALLRPLTLSVSLLQSQPNLPNSLSISQLRVSECWVHCIVSTLHFGAWPVWLFVFHFAVPGRARYFLLLHHLWLVSCLLYHFLFVIYTFKNDSAYFVSFCRGSITQKRAPRASVVPASTKILANKCAASTTHSLGPGKPSTPSHPSQ